MAYTFGGGTGDDLTFGVGLSFGTNSNAQFVAGWWRPTTLTATRGLWSAGNVWGAEIDTTTDELRLRSDNTTDGQWTTTGVDLAVNEWKFLAFLITQTNTGPAVAWKVWAGTIDTPPVAVTVTQAVAPAGNNVGSSNFYLGNKGTGTVAFQGDIGNALVHCSGATNTAQLHPFGLAAAGVISAEAEALVLSRHVLPFWRGEVFASRGPAPASGFNTGATERMHHISMDMLPQVRFLNRSDTTTLSGLIPTINGATYSQNREPRVLIPTDPKFPRLAA